MILITVAVTLRGGRHEGLKLENGPPQTLTSHDTRLLIEFVQTLAPLNWDGV